MGVKVAELVIVPFSSTSAVNKFDVFAAVAKSEDDPLLAIDNKLDVFAFTDCPVVCAIKVPA